MCSEGWRSRCHVSQDMTAKGEDEIPQSVKDGEKLAKVPETVNEGAPDEESDGPPPLESDADGPDPPPKASTKVKADNPGSSNDHNTQVRWFA